MILFFSALLWGYDPNLPHPHRGKLQPLKNSPQAVSLTKAQKMRLQNNEPVFLRVKKEGSQSARGVAVQYIHASVDTVWDTILNYPKYTDWVENVTVCSVYKKNKNIWHTAIISEVMYISFGVYTQNHIFREKGYMYWVLDYDRLSDADDLLGYWRVEEIQKSPPLTRVDHSTELILTGVPDFILEYLSEDALVNGTRWVKRESER